MGFGIFEELYSETAVRSHWLSPDGRGTRVVIVIRSALRAVMEQLV